MEEFFLGVKRSPFFAYRISTNTNDRFIGLTSISHVDVASEETRLVESTSGSSRPIRQDEDSRLKTDNKTRAFSVSHIHLSRR